MSLWSPLAHFDPHASADDGILKKADAILSALPHVGAGGIKRVYYHWTVASLGACFNDYDGEARVVGGLWVLTQTNDPRNNVPGLNELPVASHTYMRNSNAVGVAITGMDQATPADFGPDGVTWTGLQHLCAMGAAYCVAYGIDTAGHAQSGPFAGEPNIMTHAEAGDHGGHPQVYAPYGPATTCERWDLDMFAPKPDDQPMPPSNVCGDALRALTHTYAARLKGV